MGRFTLPRDLPVRAARPQGEPQRAQVQQWKMLTATLLPPAFPRGDGKGRLGTTPGGTVNAPCVWVPRRVRANKSFSSAGLATLKTRFAVKAYGKKKKSIELLQTKLVSA